jgi:hypothetical protein
VNTEERQLTEMLHRVTPEPPRRVTVEDIAFRLANEAGATREYRREYRQPRGRRLKHREPGGSRGPGRAWSRGWAPAFAAASVFVIAGATASVATLATSHHGPATSADGVPTSSASVSSSPSTSTAPSQPSASTGPTWPPEQIAGGMWGAELINRQTFTPGSLAAGPDGGSLYAISPGYLDRINTVTGDVVDGVPYTSPIPDYPNRPVVAATTVWVLTSYSGTSVVLTGYNTTTLAPAGTVTVPVSGQVPSQPQGVLTGGSNGDLYVAAGSSVAVVNPDTRQVTQRISVSGQVNSLAVSGEKLTVAIGAFQLKVYDLVTGAQIASSSMNFGGAGGNLIATPGGVWGTVGVGMTERVWFAPNADLTQVVMVSQGAGAGLYSAPTYSGGVVWLGGSRTLACAKPATGQVMAKTTIPTDNHIVEYFGGVTVSSSGRAYVLYQNQAAQQSGVATLTPPAACAVLARGDDPPEPSAHGGCPPPRTPWPSPFHPWPDLARAEPCRPARPSRRVRPLCTPLAAPRAAADPAAFRRRMAARRVPRGGAG